MNIIKVKNYEDLSKIGAVIIAAEALLKPRGVLGFATGSTPLGTYAELVRMHKEGLLDFGGITTFNLDEYYNNPKTDKNSYYYFMHENLFNHINIKKENVHLPDGTAPDASAECARYEKAIDDAGGIDLQLLGIGHNGHIGFNEPDDFFAPVTQHIRLAESTIDANARFYGNRDEVPKSAISMGIGSIMRARRILMLISGKDKKEIAEKALYGSVTPQVPASILQYHKRCTVVLAVD
jgi:glucosamine-6-phosphate deaminase